MSASSSSSSSASASASLPNMGTVSSSSSSNSFSNPGLSLGSGEKILTSPPVSDVEIVGEFDSDHTLVELEPGESSKCDELGCSCNSEASKKIFRVQHLTVRNDAWSAKTYCEKAFKSKYFTKRCDGCKRFMMGAFYDFGPSHQYCTCCGSDANIRNICGRVFSTRCRKFMTFSLLENSDYGRAVKELPHHGPLPHSKCGLTHRRMMYRRLFKADSHLVANYPAYVIDLSNLFSRGVVFRDEATKHFVTELFKDLGGIFIDNITRFYKDLRIKMQAQALQRYNEARCLQATRKRVITRFIPAAGDLSDADFNKIFPPKKARIVNEAQRIELDTISAIPESELAPGDLEEFVNFLSS